MIAPRTIRRWLAGLFAAALLMVLTGCGGDEETSRVPAVTSTTSTTVVTAPATTTGTTAAPTTTVATTEKEVSVTVTATTTGTTGKNSAETPVRHGYYACQEGRFAIDGNAVTFGRVGILGDSYSTYEGYIPAEYESWYRRGGNNREINDVDAVTQTWWHKLLGETGSTLVTNDSYSGTTIGGIGYGGGDSSATAYTARAEKTFDGQRQYDTIIVFGGTNDSWADTPLGELQYADWDEEALKSTLPAFCWLLHELKEKNPRARIINLVNPGLKPALEQGMLAACEYYDVDCILLQAIAKDSGHPNRRGMEQIKEQILTFYRQ